jgi:hypothetical protein
LVVAFGSEIDGMVWFPVKILVFENGMVERVRPARMGPK